MGSWQIFKVQLLNKWYRSRFAFRRVDSTISCRINREIYFTNHVARPSTHQLRHAFYFAASGTTPHSNYRSFSMVRLLHHLPLQPFSSRDSRDPLDPKSIGTGHLRCLVYSPCRHTSIQGNRLRTELRYPLHPGRSGNGHLISATWDR